KADFILINGSAVVYEIKTELDTLDRLDSQIENYYKAFTKVCVITSESNYNKVQK
ncbi:MAG: sce7726 family protein, partial [Clostridiaceae bacterium]|nr:sce7726 family protein [Clostridiaceae bacterium]